MEDKIITLSISKKKIIPFSERSCNFNNNYNLENGFIDKDEERLYEVVSKLCLFGEVSPHELLFLYYTCFVE
jgi:hypothetical protein